MRILDIFIDFYVKNLNFINKIYLIDKMLYLSKNIDNNNMERDVV